MKIIPKFLAAWILKNVLAALHKWIDSITESEVRELAQKINKKIDVPYLDEKQEGEIIQKTLQSSIQAVQYLFDNVKV